MTAVVAALIVWLIGEAVIFTAAYRSAKRDKQMRKQIDDSCCCSPDSPCGCSLLDLPFTITLSEGDGCDWLNDQPIKGPELNFICVVKETERYVFLFTDTPEHKQAVLEIADRWAANPELSFTPRNAAVIRENLAEGMV